MRKKKKQSLGYGSLENRKLLAADIGISIEPMSFQDFPMIEAISQESFDQAVTGRQMGRHLAEQLSGFDPSIYFAPASEMRSNVFGFDVSRFNQEMPGSTFSARPGQSMDPGFDFGRPDFNWGVPSQFDPFDLPWQQAGLGDDGFSPFEFDGLNGPFMGNAQNVFIVNIIDLDSLNEFEPGQLDWLGLPGGLEPGIDIGHPGFDVPDDLDIDIDPGDIEPDVDSSPYGPNVLDLQDGTDGLFGSLNSESPSQTYAVVAQDDGQVEIVLSSDLTDGEIAIEVRDSSGELVDLNEPGDDSESPFTKLTFDVVAGELYEITVSATEGVEGEFQMTAAFSEAPLVDQHVDEIGEDATTLDLTKGFAETTSHFELAGDVDVFQVAASESGTVSLFAQEIDSESNSSLFVNVYDSNNEKVVSGSTNGGVSLTFEATEGETYYITLNADEGQTGTYQILLFQDIEWSEEPTDEGNDQLLDDTDDVVIVDENGDADMENGESEPTNREEPGDPETDQIEFTDLDDSEPSEGLGNQPATEEVIAVSESSELEVSDFGDLSELEDIEWHEIKTTLEFEETFSANVDFDPDESDFAAVVSNNSSVAEDFDGPISGFTFASTPNEINPFFDILTGISNDELASASVEAIELTDWELGEALSLGSSETPVLEFEFYQGSPEATLNLTLLDALMASGVFNVNELV